MKLSSYLPIAFTIAAYANSSANTAITNFNQIDTVSIERTFPSKLPYSTSNMHSENLRSQYKQTSTGILQFLEFSIIAGIFISAQKARVYNKSAYA